MLGNMTWEAVETAYANMINKGYKQHTPLTLLMELPGDTGVHRSKIDVATFRKSIWCLYESKRTFANVRVVAIEDDNTIAFHYDTNTRSIEKLPPEDDRKLVFNWTKTNTARKKALVKMLTAEIAESSDVG